ncbi:MAG: hydrogenase maturation nickel metallochaperone HypA [Bdellovibrionaceae bacterium]|nr:hydrogenase maturation nickel metallochaperone HypA [Pseudobdellovibrionaceae bacterium]
MHELSIAYDVIEQVEAAAIRHGFKKVNQIHLLVGEWSGVDVEALQFCFPEATRKTCLKDAHLLITCKGLTIQCLDCFELTPISREQALACAKCGSVNTKIIEGKELRIVDLDVD